MKSLGLNVSAEVIEPHTGLSVDLAVHGVGGDGRQGRGGGVEGGGGGLGGCTILVEVDGPYHYASFRSRYPLGATRLKRKLLHLATRNTSRVVSIPYWEWTPSVVTRPPLHASSSPSSASDSSSAPSTGAQSVDERERERDARWTEQEEYLCRLLRRSC
jgi:hypothetical protein